MSENRQLSLQNLLEKTEQRLDLWLNALEQKPISTGIKTIACLVVLRWVWRNVK